MGAEGGTSLLETPPYVIAVVFLFFLVVTLGFEWVCLPPALLNPERSCWMLRDESVTTLRS